VKREDMYEPPIPLTYRHPVDFPPPPFAKTRGLLPYLQKLRERGTRTVAYMDTSISMAGWGLAYCAPLADLQAIVFYPRYKEGPRHNIAEHAKRCTQLGAEVRYLERPAQMSINWYRVKNYLVDNYNDAVLLPQGLPFMETLYSVAEEVNNVPKAALGGTLVVSVGSGTMLAGILTGLNQNNIRQHVHGILVSEGDVVATTHKIISKSCGRMMAGHWWKNYLQLYWTGYKYIDTVEMNIPFPCNKYYDAKAWRYLAENLHILEKPILFWNIGA